jgi:hypothetical protein
MRKRLRIDTLCWKALASLWLWVAVGASAEITTAEPMRYIRPPPESGADVRMNYYWELLQAALDETNTPWGPYTLTSSTRVVNSARAEMLLAASTEITLMARTTSADREVTLLPIRIPLDKGLTGYRIFATKSTLQSRLNRVRSLEDLQEFSIGQGVNWIDTDILRKAGFKVVTGPTYDVLFPMLAANRFELFSRGINEIGMEYAAAKPGFPELVIERKLLLYYPLPRYYFFARTPEGERLAKRVEEGLRLLMKNGKFEKRYQAFKRSILTDLPIAGRRIIRIDNPYLSAATPLAERELWDTLDAELRR